ncbi:MAG TPA: M13 family metallopeptidase, partial [Gemmatimonadales bacterium]|nr:M13 family metallopeptidase [Gemmatimonadales bacterium]
MRRDDEQAIDQLGTGDHFRTPPPRRSYEDGFGIATVPVRLCPDLIQSCRAAAPKSGRPCPSFAPMNISRSAILGVLALMVTGTAATTALAQGVEQGVDTSIAPGDDFFAYANGVWLRTTAIPEGRERWGVRNEIDAQTRRQIADLLEGARAAPRGTAARTVADFRAAWLDEAAIEARGVAAGRPVLDSIDRVRDKASLTRLLGRWIGADVDPLNYGVYQSARLVGLSVEAGINGERDYPAFLLQGGLGLPDRDYYLGAEPRMQALRTRYRTYVARLLTLAGFDRADARAVAVVELETALARSQATHAVSANDHNADHRWTRADFAREAPGMDWPAFLAAAGLSGQDTIAVWQPGAMTGVAALVASVPLDTWKDYLRVHLLDEAADVLPHAFADEALAMRSAVSGQPPATRAERALEATQRAFGDAIGRMYVELYFSPTQKARVQSIVANVAAAFRRQVAATTWLSPATRTLALAKLRTLDVGIGYPDRWDGHADLVVDPADALGNRRRALERSHRDALARLGRPVDLTQWWIAPQAVGAVLTFQQNAYDFAAGLLQPPKYDSTASDAANYGAVGAIIGHDISHFIDVLGADYDTVFAERHWWTAEDMAHFEAAAEPLVQQFNAYHPFPDVAVNGRLTRTENVADLAGLTAAFEAYRLTLGDRSRDTTWVRQQDRQFFIAWARSWRIRIRDEALRTQATSSD